MNWPVQQCCAHKSHNRKTKAPFLGKWNTSITLSVFMWPNEEVPEHFEKWNYHLMPYQLFHTWCRPETSTRAANFTHFFFFFRNEGIKFSNWRLSLKCRQMESNGDGRTGKLSLPHLKASDVVLSSRIVFPTQRPGHSLYDPWLKPFQCYWQCRARVTQHLMQCINKIIRTTF